MLEILKLDCLFFLMFLLLKLLKLRLGNFVLVVVVVVFLDRLENHYYWENHFQAHFLLCVLPCSVCINIMFTNCIRFSCYL